MTDLPNYTNDPRVQALTPVLRRWVATHPGWHHEWIGTGWRQRSAQEIAAQILPDLKKMDVQLAGVLQSPDGQLIRAVASWVLPGQQAFLVGLLADAVLLAAQAHNKDQKIAAGALAAAAAVLIIGVIAGE